LQETKPIPVTVVFDIGRTNKKLLLFDEDLEVVHQQYATLEEVKDYDEDGHPCENLAYLTEWVNQQLKTVVQNENFNIQALNFSAYGASLVHLNEQGKVVTPLYDYLKPYPEKLLRQFYETYGSKEKFALETASPPMGMLNSGLQLYWLKYAKPSLYNNIHHTLHFPQYLSFLFTQKYATKYTSIGCHTGMWNYEEQNYHRWLKEEKMCPLLPPIQPVTDTSPIQFSGANFQTGPGMHDSSAALIPYLYAMEEPFLLLSTGTWSVTLNPFNDAPLTFEELQRDCLCFMNMNGDQVKAARLFLGSEYAHQKEKLDSYFGRSETDTAPVIDQSLLRRTIKEDDSAKKLRLETAYSSGPFPGKKPEEWKPNLFSSYEEAYHQLMIDLVAIQAVSIKLAEGDQPIGKVIVAGGFSRNSFFLKLLASRFPQKEIYTASLSHVSALGAAVVVNDNHVKQKLQELLNLERYLPLKHTGIEQYRWRK
jgi:sugar (pentulose or hexulose) kinase